MRIFSKGYKFTKNWFKTREVEITKHIDPNKIINVLEIGCYEGQSTCFFLEKLLKNRGSKLHCVDPYFISEVDSSIEKRFHKNIKLTSHGKNPPIHFFRQTSDKYFEENRCKFDLIYIDGHNAPGQIERDLINSWVRLKKNGILWANHRSSLKLSKGYLKEFEDHAIFTRNIINKFLNNNRGLYSPISKKNQLAIRKI
jgi:hypothetical protein